MKMYAMHECAICEFRVFDENPFSGFFLLYNMEIYTSGKPIRIINVVPVYNSHKSDVDIYIDKENLNN